MTDLESEHPGEVPQEDAGGAPQNPETGPANGSAERAFELVQAFLDQHRELFTDETIDKLIQGELKTCRSASESSKSIL